MERITPDRVVGRPGWLCEHGMSRDICLECVVYLPDWVALADAKEPYNLMKKVDLADKLRQWMAQEGLEVSDLDGPSFRLRLHTNEDKADEEPEHQVYRLTLAIPKDKAFEIATDWQDLQVECSTPDGDDEDEDEDEIPF